LMLIIEVMEGYFSYMVAGAQEKLICGIPSYLSFDLRSALS